MCPKFVTLRSIKPSEIKILVHFFFYFSFILALIFNRRNIRNQTFTRWVSSGPTVVTPPRRTLWRPENEPSGANASGMTPSGRLVYRDIKHKYTCKKNSYIIVVFCIWNAQTDRGNAHCLKWNIIMGRLFHMRVSSIKSFEVIKM